MFHDPRISVESREAWAIGRPPPAQQQTIGPKYARQRLRIDTLIVHNAFRAV